jgi:hypothetical protein
MYTIHAHTHTYIHVCLAVFCEFEADELTEYLIHPSRIAVACKFDNMAALNKEAKRWQECIDACLAKMPCMAVPRETLRIILLLMGTWNSNGEAEGVALITLVVPFRRAGHASKSMGQAEHIQLVQLGTYGGSGDLFDDLASIRQQSMQGTVRLRRIRVWQSAQSSTLKGGIVALQAFYSDQNEVLARLYCGLRMCVCVCVCVCKHCVTNMTC